MFVIEVFRGDTVSIEVQFLQDDDSPLDLTGWSVYFAARKSDGTILVNKGVSMTNPANGIGILSFTPSDISIAGKFQCEFEARMGDQIKTLEQGYLVVREDIRK